ncbi:aspartic proteinase CDR1-like [Impatiens glandulifera]|uniref:aspartic proteinase CDR1-like n=1 Tax=Impatiens glandulifera TaxID=253017 RepID=UPI001FB14181|nr:aspartic proteinase CDR1-like [Impatiens glandulifera]
MSDIIRGSESRLFHFNYILELSNNKAKKTNDVYARIMPTYSTYLMEISIGTPPVKQFVLPDTASEVSWTQCLPCVNCYEQKQIMFNSKKSSSYKVLSCGSDQCKDLGEDRVCNDLRESECRYNISSYVGKASSSGELALETYKLGRTSFPNMVYGCGNYKNIISIEKGSSGVFGLGSGPLSFISQLRESLGRKFSYCLVSHSKRNVRRKFTLRNLSSKLNFGTRAIVSGRGVVSTPLVTKPSSPLYYLTLEAISVNNKRIPFTRLTRSMREGGVDIIEEGNIIIDSGTPITYLPTNIYETLKDELKRSIHADSIQVPGHPGLLCYVINKKISIPFVTFHFHGGANLNLPSTSTFSQAEGFLFLTMLPSNNTAIFGNFLQMNFLIGYDIDIGKVFFKPTVCSSWWRRIDGSDQEWSMAP